MSLPNSPVELIEARLDPVQLQLEVNNASRGDLKTCVRATRLAQGSSVSKAKLPDLKRVITAADNVAGLKPDGSVHLKGEPIELKRKPGRPSKSEVEYDGPRKKGQAKDWTEAQSSMAKSSQDGPTQDYGPTDQDGPSKGKSDGKAGKAAKGSESETDLDEVAKDAASTVTKAAEQMAKDIAETMQKQLDKQAQEQAKQPPPEMDPDLLAAMARAACEKAAKDLGDEGKLKTELQIKMPDGKIRKIPGVQHKAFPEIVETLAAGLNVLLVGPAGTGKTTAARQAAKALELTFTFNSMSAGMSEGQLLGRTLPDPDGGWTYKPSPFAHTYENGGLHLFDEIDAADPNLMVQINAAIANGHLSVPFKTDPAPILRHESTRIIAAANTFGFGADRQYVGRNQLDAATLDRFTAGTIEVDYDPDLDRALAETILDKRKKDATLLLEWAWDMREKIGRSKLRRFMSTRFIEDGSKLMAAGVKFAKVKDRFTKSWSEDEKNKVKNA